MFFGLGKKQGDNSASNNPDEQNNPAASHITADANSFSMQPQMPQGPSEQPKHLIFDANVSNFENTVIRQSMERIVIVQFWTPRCGPCKQLMPILEQEVNAAGGKILMAKVNLDENQELGMALRIQSVPTVYAFFQGQPINGFQGAKSPAEVKAFVQELVTAINNAQPDALDIDEALKQAAEFLSNKQLMEAQQLYTAILQQDQTNAKAFAGIVRTFIAAGQVQQAEQVLANAPEEMKKTSAYEEAQVAIELAKEQPSSPLSSLQQAVDKNPDDLDALFELACAEYTQGMVEDAIDHLLAIIRKNREWKENKAKDKLLKFFEALGPSDPHTMAGRRKLSTLLFS